MQHNCLAPLAAADRFAFRSLQNPQMMRTSTPWRKLPVSACCLSLGRCPLFSASPPAGRRGAQPLLPVAEVLKFYFTLHCTGKISEADFQRPRESFASQDQASRRAGGASCQPPSSARVSQICCRLHPVRKSNAHLQLQFHVPCLALASEIIRIDA